MRHVVLDGGPGEDGRGSVLCVFRPLADDGEGPSSNARHLCDGRGYRPAARPFGPGLLPFPQEQLRLLPFGRSTERPAAGLDKTVLCAGSTGLLRTNSSGRSPNGRGPAVLLGPRGAAGEDGGREGGGRRILRSSDGPTGAPRRRDPCSLGPRLRPLQARPRARSATGRPAWAGAGEGPRPTTECYRPDSPSARCCPGPCLHACRPRGPGQRRRRHRRGGDR